MECFDASLNTCRLDGLCLLKRALKEAMAQYLAVLDGVTLADLVTPGQPPLGGAGDLLHATRLSHRMAVWCSLEAHAMRVP